ncbi:MAG: tetratricopeptide repeat protein [Cyclobacteriaceae bacterium]
MKRNVFAIFVVVLLIGVHAVSAEVSPREYFKFARFKFDKEDFNGAVEFLNKAIELDSKYSNAYLLRAEAFFMQGEFSLTINDINKAFELEEAKTTFFARYYLIRGKSHIELGDKKKGLADIEKCLEISPNHAMAYYERSHLRYGIRNYDGAFQDINKAIELESDEAVFYAGRAALKLNVYNPSANDKIYESIIADFRKAIALDPSNYDFYKQRSEFYRVTGSDMEALADYNAMIEINPQNNDVYRERGLLKMQKQDYRNAFQDFTQSIKLKPSDELSYRYRGMCAHNSRQYNQAISDFSKAIEKLNESILTTEEKDRLQNILAETYLMRGHALQALGNSNEACFDFVKAYDLGVKKGLNYYRKFCGYY